MIKKYIRLYKEAVALAIRYPQFVLLFLFSNILTFLDFYYINETLNGILFPIAFVLRLAALGGIGYLIIYLLRRNEPPKYIFTRGVMHNFWKMLKYMVLQLIILSVTSIIPIAILENQILFPPFVEYFWLWVNEYLFIFLILEAIFWEDKGIWKSYRIRNIFMLARFEWMFPVFIIVKLPFIIINLLKIRYYDWLFKGFWIVIPVLFIISLDWVNTIFSFKVYGEDRLGAVQEVEEKIKESSKKMKEKIRQKREGR